MNSANNVNAFKVDSSHIDSPDENLLAQLTP